eukprot:14775428-Alexandrium_andersonii.AAC.1
MSQLDLDVERMLCDGALKGAGRIPGIDGARARKVGQEMQGDGKGELFTMFNQSPAPWAGGDYRTHPTIVEITWGVL